MGYIVEAMLPRGDSFFALRAEDDFHYGAPDVGGLVVPEAGAVAAFFGLAGDSGFDAVEPQGLVAVAEWI